MIVCNKGLPFELKIPNDETLHAMEEAKKFYKTVSITTINEA
jgi:antitoxin component of RelBE/YafQ-DinJ toxin-antitoxin module